MVNGLIVLGACAALYALVYFIGGKGGGSQVKEKFESQLKIIQDQESALKSKLTKTENLVSGKQIANVQSQLDSIEASIAQERAQLAKVEESLNKSQQNVEQRENNHQNMKIAKLDEEERIAKLLERHESLAAESIQLEKTLAEAMKNLDKIMSETDLSQDHRDALKQLQSALESAGSRLRELISEYESVKNRVDMLRQQHQDLEEEYTRLVELQLG